MKVKCRDYSIHLGFTTRTRDGNGILHARIRGEPKNSAKSQVLRGHLLQTPLSKTSNLPVIHDTYTVSKFYVVRELPFLLFERRSSRRITVLWEHCELKGTPENEQNPKTSLRLRMSTNIDGCLPSTSGRFLTTRVHGINYGPKIWGCQRISTYGDLRYVETPRYIARNLLRRKSPHGDETGTTPGYI